METEAPAYTVQATEIPGQFIHEYPNGRRVLIEVDPDTGKETFIREL
jgi:hypothetical protein